MLPYNYGLHLDLGLVGRLDLVGADLDFATGTGGNWEIEAHIIPYGAPGDICAINSRAGSTRSWGVGIGNRFFIAGFAGESFERTGVLPAPSKPTRLLIRAIGGVRSATVDNNGITTEIDLSGYTGNMPTELQEVNGFSNSYKLALLIARRNDGNGLEDAYVFDPSVVSDGAGGFVPRGDAAAEAGSEYKLYDTVGGRVYDFNNQVDGAFENVYDVVDVNGGTIELGETGATVTMSSSIGIDDVYFTDGNKEYHPTFSVNAETITFDVPLASDDTMPLFGTLTMHVVSGADEFTKTFEFAAPTGSTLVTLATPIIIDETSYTNGTTLNPAEGDFYFYEPTTDFSITENNVFQPVGDAPWRHIVWYLSGAGLRRTFVEPGYVSLNPLPTVNQTTLPQTVTVGDQIQVSATASDYDTFQWIADLDGTFDDENALEAVFTTAEHGQLTITAVAENAEGSRSDSVTHTVEEPIAMGEFTATHQNVPDGQIETVVVNLDTSEVLFNGMKSWANGQATFSFENLADGSRIQVSTLNETDQDGGLSVEYAA